MGLMSREKGKRGEREVAALLREHGFEAKRGVQYTGGADSPDVCHDMDGFHIEVKLVEALKLYDALDQANGDKRPADDALVFHRRNHKPWVVIMDAEAFLKLMTRFVFQ